MPYRHRDPIDGPAGRSLWDRADQVMVGGGIYLTRSADMAGRGVQPGFIATAEGCHVTDVDGRVYVDLMGANGPNVLGYRHPEVEAAVDEVRRRITTASLFPPQLVEVIERLVVSHRSMAWGVVAKNGSEVVSLGARIARHHTGRRAIVTFDQAYHGNDPELALGPPAGPLTEITADVHRLPWNGADELVDHLFMRAATARVRRVWANRQVFVGKLAPDAENLQPLGGVGFAEEAVGHAICDSNSASTVDDVILRGSVEYFGAPGLTWLPTCT